ncbi:uncharacterized protein SCHCODRAFT_02639861 [Schizophyllum commune H4-8]|nr:uncharacterized protein SCHCODRAFT_02639861 [Schizophyllum commune H4-8]KAI5886801.1 hypothetical protein SCHCODRAFT_02639861 [Schizophyllum commune H4-8]
MVDNAFVWRCSKVGCPDPDFPKDYKAEHCTSSRGPALCKSMRHGWKYHYKQVTVPWKGGRTTLVRDKVTGLFCCPCGAPSHACQDGQRMFRLCRRRVHPSTNDDVTKPTDNEQNGSPEEDDDDEDESQPCILIASSPSPDTPTSSTSKAGSSASAHPETSSSRARCATRTRPKTVLSTYAPASRQSRRKRARSVSSSSDQYRENSEGEEDSQILVLKQEFQKLRQKREAMWRRLIDKEKEELKKDMKRAKLG